MLQEWLLELLAGFGKLFIHPIFYFSFLLAFVVGMFRVARERKDFHTRVYDIYQEVRYILPSSLLIGLLLSIAAIGFGFTLPLELLNVIAAVTIVLSAGGFRLLSPAWTIGIALLLFAASERIGYLFIPYEGLSLHKILTTMAIILALLLMTEGLLMFKRGWQGTSPRLVKSPRGLKVGVQFAQRLWLVPVFLVLPAGDLASPWPWWPVISIGSDTYSFIWFPFLVGFAQLIKSTLPELAIKATGKNIMAVGAVALLLAIAAYWVPQFAAVGAAFALITRIWISWRHYSYEKDRHYFFTPQPKGVMILGILPYTPAKKMDLKIGEIIYKVNGMDVNTESEFYEALQKNAAYCKLEVVDVNGQNRFAQASLYEGQHYGLGLIFVEEEKEFRTEEHEYDM